MCVCVVGVWLEFAGGADILIPRLMRVSCEQLLSSLISHFAVVLHNRNRTVPGPVAGCRPVEVVLYFVAFVDSSPPTTREVCVCVCVCAVGCGRAGRVGEGRTCQNPCTGVVLVQGCLVYAAVRHYRFCPPLLSLDFAFLFP